MAPVPDGISDYGHDSSYYGVPTWSPIEVKRHFEQQDGRNDDGADLGGLEHAAIITGAIATAQATGWVCEYMSCKTKSKYPKVSKGLHYLGAGLTVCLTLARTYMKATGGRYPDGIGSGGRGETYDLKKRLPKCPKDTIPKGRSDVAGV